VFPTSSFLIPTKIEQAQFVSALKEGNLASAAVDIKPEDEFNQFVVALAMLLHVELVMSEGAACLYAKSIQNHQVFVYAKPLPSGVRVEIKSPEESLSKSLVNEVGGFFQRV